MPSFYREAAYVHRWGSVPSSVEYARICPVDVCVTRQGQADAGGIATAYPTAEPAANSFEGNDG